MTRLSVPAEIAEAPSASRAGLETVAKQRGRVPNMFRAIALSPQPLEGRLGLFGARPAAPRERVALAVCEVNGCGYVSQSDFAAVKAAGYNKARVIEIVAPVVLNAWTNCFNDVFRTDINFPVVAPQRAAA